MSPLAKSLQLCPTLCDPIDGSPLGSSVPGILQARTLEWVAISFSNAWKWKVKVKSLSRVQLFLTPWTAANQAPPSMGFSRQEYWSGVPSPSLDHKFSEHPLSHVDTKKQNFEKTLLQITGLYQIYSKRDVGLQTPFPSVTTSWVFSTTILILSEARMHPSTSPPSKSFMVTRICQVFPCGDHWEPLALHA